MANILIVEDDPILLKFYRHLFLHNSDHEIRLASNGKEALDLFSKNNFDLVALDIMMPEISGIQVLEKIKADPRGKDITVVMLTALNDSSVVGECVRKGATGFIIKSEIEPEKLMQVLDSYLINNK